MPLSSVQKGAVGQFAFVVAVLVTGKGEVEVYVPTADNEGRDAEVRRHLKSLPGVGIQIKIAFSLHKNQRGLTGSYLEVSFSLPERRIQNDPRLWYFFAVYDPTGLRLRDPVFLIRSDIFHKMGRLSARRGVVSFRIMANMAPESRDRWTPFRVWVKDLGNRVLEIIDDTPLMAEVAALPLPIDAVVVGLRKGRGRSARRLRAARFDRKYTLIRNAVLARESLSGWYQGHLRLFSPFLLGKKAGDPHVLGYQFDGTSEKPLAPEGSPENWRCLRLADLTKVKALPGIWHAVPKGKGFQHCIDQVDVSAYRPAPGRRQLRRAA